MASTVSAGSSTRLRDHLKRMFDAAVDAARAETCLPPHLPLPGASGRIILLAGGKAAGAMMQVAEAAYLDDFALPRDRLTGLCVTRHGYARPLRFLETIEAGHPVPDAAGVAASERILNLAASANRDDHIVVLLSGGASANWVAPVDGVTLDDKQAVTRTLLASGATIDEINTVRRHLSRIKGGRLAAARGPRGAGPRARMTTLAVSDVPHDDAIAIASGPTLGDPTTLADARALVARYAPDAPAAIRTALEDPANETPDPEASAFTGTDFRLVARPQRSLDAAAAVARDLGYEPILLGDSLEGEAREVAADQAAHAIALAGQGRKCVLLSGGELTVTINGDGRGGPNQEFALALAIALDGHQRVAGLAADTDGTDGGTGAPDDPAGAVIDATTLSRGEAQGHDAAAFLKRNDSTRFFDALGDLLRPGPTYTNVNDFRAVIVDKSEDDRP